VLLWLLLLSLIDMCGLRASREGGQHALLVGLLSSRCHTTHDLARAGPHCVLFLVSRVPGVCLLQGLTITGCCRHAHETFRGSTDTINSSERNSRELNS
jgi:hypothetical protein